MCAGFKKIRSGLLLLLTIAVAACGSNDNDTSWDNTGLGFGTVSNQYPYLISAPVISYSPSAMVMGSYDVTITVEANGPNGVYSALVWLFKSNGDPSTNGVIDLANVGGTTWSGTTNSFLPEAPGDYYIDSITLEDGDPFDTVTYPTVKSGWYFLNPLFSNSDYFFDQREVDWATVNILSVNIGISNIAISTASLP